MSMNYEAERERAFSLNADLFLAFLKRLIRVAERKVFLLLGGLDKDRHGFALLRLTA